MLEGRVGKAEAALALVEVVRDKSEHLSFSRPTSRGAMVVMGQT